VQSERHENKTVVCKMALTKQLSLEELLQGMVPASSWKNVLQSLAVRWTRVSCKQLQFNKRVAGTDDEARHAGQTNRHLLLSLDGYFPQGPPDRTLLHDSQHFGKNKAVQRFFFGSWEENHFCFGNHF
jgi:hypothetical protein